MSSCSFKSCSLLCDVILCVSFVRQIRLGLHTTLKPVLSGHSKIDKTKVLKTDGSLMQVESIAECSLGAFYNTFDLHYAIISLEKQFLVFFGVAA